MKNKKKMMDVAGYIGVVFFLLATGYDWVAESSIKNFKLKDLYDIQHIVAILLSLIFGLLLFDRQEMRENVEEKIKTFTEKATKDLEGLGIQVDGLKGIEILHSTEIITVHTINALKHTTNTIRVTNFKSLMEDNDSSINYYDALNDVLKHGRVQYVCAIHENANTENRLASIKKLLPDVQKIVKERITFYVYKNMQRPMNIMIMDYKVAFIGYYTHRPDKHMKNVIKITDENTLGEDMIKNLVTWYDGFITNIPNGVTDITCVTGSDYFPQEREAVPPLS